MQTIAVVAIYTNGVWSFERLSEDDQGNIYSETINQAEYDQALSGGAPVPCEDCP